MRKYFGEKGELDTKQTEKRRRSSHIEKRLPIICHLRLSQFSLRQGAFSSRQALPIEGEVLRRSGEGLYAVIYYFTTFLPFMM